MQSVAGTGGGGTGHHQVQPGGGQVGAPASSGGTGDDEAPKDPGARITHQSYTEKDFEGTHSNHRIYSQVETIFVIVTRIHETKNKLSIGILILRMFRDEKKPPF